MAKKKSGGGQTKLQRAKQISGMTGPKATVVRGSRAVSALQCVASRVCLSSGCGYFGGVWGARGRGLANPSSSRELVSGVWPHGAAPLTPHPLRAAQDKTFGMKNKKGAKAGKIMQNLNMAANNVISERQKMVGGGAIWGTGTAAAEPLSRACHPPPRCPGPLALRHQDQQSSCPASELGTKAPLCSHAVV